MIEYHQVQETDQETEVGQLFRVFDTEGTGLIGSNAHHFHDSYGLRKSFWK